MFRGVITVAFLFFATMAAAENDETLTAQQPEDLLNQVEVEIPTTLPYLMRCKRHWGRIYSKRFLRKHDPVFQHVLEL